MALIEIPGIDLYQVPLMQGGERPVALASDLIEEVRASIVDSLVLWLVDKNAMDAQKDFVHHEGGYYWNESGQKKYIKVFLQRMKKEVQIDFGEKQPR